MKVQGTVTMDLDMGQSHALVVEILRNDYASLARDTLALWGRWRELEGYEREDFRNNCKVLRGMDYALEYYMEWGDHQQWRDAWQHVVDLYEDREAL